MKSHTDFMIFVYLTYLYRTFREEKIYIYVLPYHCELGEGVRVLSKRMLSAEFWKFLLLRLWTETVLH